MLLCSPVDSAPMGALGPEDKTWLDDKGTEGQGPGVCVSMDPVEILRESRRTLGSHTLSPMVPWDKG